MATTIYDYNWPDRVVIGTLGEPGARTFYLQARAGSELTSIALEKQQAAVVAEMIDEILDQLSTMDGNPFNVPEHTPVELVDNSPLEEVIETFRVGAMNLGWDATVAQVVLEAFSLNQAEDEDFDPDGPGAQMQVRMPVGTARAFAMRTHEIVAAGRPICTKCGNPIDPDGHACGESAEG